jgi:hypothetical protein
MDNDLRVSHADRERTAAQLRDHFAAGRLTHSELDDRLGAALSAVTSGDLRRVTGDLPAPGGWQLERRYRRLLALYPARYRRSHEDEILAVLLSAAADGQIRPSLAEAADLIMGALRVRAHAFRGRRGWRAAMALTGAGALLGLAAGAGLAAARPRAVTSTAIVAVTGKDSRIDLGHLREDEWRFVRERLASADEMIGAAVPLAYLENHVRVITPTDRLVEIQVQASNPALAVRAANAVTDAYFDLVRELWPAEGGAERAVILQRASITPGTSAAAEIAEYGGLGTAAGALAAAIIAAAQTRPPRRRLRAA